MQILQVGIANWEIETVRPAQIFGGEEQRRMPIILGKEWKMASVLTSQPGNFATLYRFAARFLSPFVAVARWNHERQTRNSLSSLTDRQLQDIGLVRGDIDDIALNTKTSV